MPAFQDTLFPSGNAVFSAQVVASMVATPQGLQEVSNNTWGILRYQHDLEIIHIQARLLLELQAMEAQTKRKIHEAYNRMTENDFVNDAGAFFTEQWQRRNGITPNPWAIRGAALPEAVEQPAPIPAEPAPVHAEPIEQEEVITPNQDLRIDPFPLIDLTNIPDSPITNEDPIPVPPPAYRRRERRQGTPAEPRAMRLRYQRQVLARACHGCGSLGHMRKDCPNYICYRCRCRQPGHLTSQCPRQV